MDMSSEGTKPRAIVLWIPAFLLFAIAIPYFVLLIGTWLDRIMFLPQIPPIPLNWIFGVLLSWIGLAMGLGSIYQLYKRGHGLPWGDVTPPSQSTQLVTDGLYHYTRNPMALGYAIFIDGWGWLFQSPSTALVLPTIFLTLLYIYWIKYEEPQMAKRFGEAYEAYKKTTPRLFPRLW